MDILITGIAGSGGSYLADFLLEHQPQTKVHGIARWHSTTSHSNISHIQNKICIHECDLMDLSSIQNVFKQVKPEIIFHIASYANVRTAFQTPLAVLNNNIMGTANLFEAIRLCNIDPIVQLCSTSEVYGQVDPQNVPITETCTLNPASPYAVSKLTQDMLGYSYFKNYNMKIIRTRMFAYFNPRREDLFATAFAKQIARIERGLQKELVHGNLDSVRTMIDVRDAMEAYWIAATKCSAGEVYNIGGITSLSVGEFLQYLKKYAKVTIPSRQDPALLRPTDVTLQVPSVEKFKQKTGWQPKYSFDESAQYLLNYWRKKIDLEIKQTEFRI